VTAHPLSGADIGTLLRVLRDGGGPDHRLRALGIWGSVLARLPFSTLECILIGKRLPDLADLPPPVFILGHWRSGTTHLYNIMSLGGFGYVPPLAAGLPWDMFGLARALRPLLERQLPRRRFIDNLPVTPTSPQEDEIALANMSPLSFYHGLYFPRHFDRLIDRGLFFDGCTEAEIAGWQSRFGYLLRKLSLLQGKPMLIKNPAHTARPAMLRAMFPGAKFIHIHRNPFEVFVSMQNFYTKLLEVLALQDRPAGLDIDATILRVYVRMMARFEIETAGWAAPDFIELPYDLLDREPMAAFERIYAGLELDGYTDAAPRFRAYLGRVERFQKNEFRGDASTVEKVAKALGHWIDKWSYQHPAPAGIAS
jgi:hypothetical protein